ncbi:hypothetical protein FOZ63_006830, partial [Perkinsus olseni]
ESHHGRRWLTHFLSVLKRYEGHPQGHSCSHLQYQEDRFVGENHEDCHSLSGYDLLPECLMVESVEVAQCHELWRRFPVTGAAGDDAVVLEAFEDGCGAPFFGTGPPSLRGRG